MMDCSVPEDYIDSAETDFNLFETILGDSWLPRLECVLLELGYAVDRGRVSFSTTSTHRFVQELLSKQMSEGYGMIGSLQKGAFLSGHHSARSTLELYAVCNYVFSKPSKTEGRIKKFYQFGELAKFNLYQREKQNGHDIIKTIPQSMIDTWEQKIPEWFSTYGLKLKEKSDERSLLEQQAESLAKVRNWHHPATIENMPSSFGDDRWIKGIYDSLSHGTHFSPHSKLLTGGTPIGLPIAGPQQANFRLINRLIACYLIGLKGTVRVVEKNLEMDFGIGFPPLDLDA